MTKAERGMRCVYILFLIVAAVLCIPTCDDHFFRIWKFDSILDFLLLHPNNWGGYTFAVPHNGRYLGNVIGFLLGKSYNKWIGLPFRVLVLAGGMYGLFWILEKMFGKGKKGTELIMLLLVLTPVHQYTQVLHWTAGFSNYFLPVLGVLILFYCLSISKPKKRHYVLGVVTAFLVQLFVEHVTIYVMLFLLISAIMEWREKRKEKLSRFLFLAALLGAGVMFSNTGYRLVGSDQYRVIGLQSVFGTLRLLAYDVVIGNGVLFFVAGICFWLLAGQKSRSKKNGVCWGGYGLLTAYSLFRTFTVSLALEQYRRLDLAVAPILLFYLFYFSLTLIKTYQKETIFYLISICVINGMLLFLTPISARCAYISFILLLLFVLTLVLETAQESFFDYSRMVAPLAIAAVCYGGYLLFCFGWNAVVQYQWEIYCAEQRKIHAEALFVPELPYPHLVYDSNSLIYYLYSIYYEEPNDIYFEMWDYNRWHSAKCAEENSRNDWER